MGVRRAEAGGHHTGDGVHRPSRGPGPGRPFAHRVVLLPGAPSPAGGVGGRPRGRICAVRVPVGEDGAGARRTEAHGAGVHPPLHGGQPRSVHPGQGGPARQPHPAGPGAGGSGSGGRRIGHPGAGGGPPGGDPGGSLGLPEPRPSSEHPALGVDRPGGHVGLHHRHLVCPAGARPGKGLVPPGPEDGGRRSAGPRRRADPPGSVRPALDPVVRRELGTLRHGLLAPVRGVRGVEALPLRRTRLRRRLRGGVHRAFCPRRAGCPGRAARRLPGAGARCGTRAGACCIGTPLDHSGGGDPGGDHGPWRAPQPIPGSSDGNGRRGDP
jgi:hypothetical protein